MSKLTLTGFVLPLFLLFASPQASSPKAFAATKKAPEGQGQTGTLQKMIAETGSVTMDLDLNRLNGIGAVHLQFTLAANSFFSILVFNDLLRGPEQGSMALVPQNSAAVLPVLLAASIKQLIVEKLPSDAAFDLAVRDAKTGFTFFDIEGHQYDYDGQANLLTMTGGLRLSKEFAAFLGHPADTGVAVGKISLGAAMQTIEVRQLDENGNVKAAKLPALT